MRVSSYDGDTYGTSHPVSYYYDINRIIDESWFSEKERKEVVKYAMDLFEDRIHRISETSSDSYQLVATNTQEVMYYDVIMTLNVEWDGPALGLERIFSSYKEWMLETIDYIKTQTSATMLIREHPYITTLTDYDDGNWEQVAKERIGDCDRIYFCYYDTLKCVWSAKNVDHYFSLLQEGLQNNLVVTKEQKEIAAMAFALILNHINDDVFGEFHTEWYALSLEELLQRKNVKKILMVIGDNVPSLYLNVLERIGNT